MSVFLSSLLQIGGSVFSTEETTTAVTVTVNDYDTNLEVNIKGPIWYRHISTGIESINRLSEHSPKSLFINLDDSYVYNAFGEDFGPLNINATISFIKLMKTHLKDYETGKIDKIVICSNPNKKQRSNTATLLCTFLMLHFEMNPQEAYSTFMLLENSDCIPRLPGYRDAASGTACYFLSVLDILRGIHRGLVVEKFVNINEFNLREYSYYEEVEHGDINWIIPGKIMAFASPDPDSFKRRAQLCLARGEEPFTLENLISFFKARSVKYVVKLNRVAYSQTVFEQEGISVIDLHFPDGTIPPLKVLAAWFQLMHQIDGGQEWRDRETHSPISIAVHCKAGLGRTGSLIGAWLMRRYKFNAREAIAWLRVMRPGSVVAQQQQWLESMTETLWNYDNTNNHNYSTVSSNGNGVNGGSGHLKQPRKMKYTTGKPDLNPPNNPQQQLQQKSMKFIS